MTKVMYVGVYREGTGWSEACIGNMRAMKAAGIDVVARPLILGKNVPPPEDILALEAKPAYGCKTVIQHTLPHTMDYHGGFRNIAFYVTETSHFRHSNWADRLNTMDEAWVPNHQMIDAGRASGVTIPYSVVNHSFDIEKYAQNHGTLESLNPYKEQGDFLFYFVGENVRRKNLEALIKAFHLEFHPDESVQLVIKSSMPGLDAQASESHIRTVCQMVKQGLKLYGSTEKYKPEIIITDRLTERGMVRLHSTCDCFVMPSCGEAFCIPAWEAMAMGKTPIVPASTGFLEYVTNNEGWLVKTFETPVIGANDTFGDLFVGTETWQTVDILDLRRCMRAAFANAEEKETKSANGIDKSFDFSYLSVGLKIADLLARQ